MKFKGKLENISIDFETGKAKYTFLSNSKNVSVEAEKLKNIELDIEAVKTIKKRSLNANNYAWKLITEIANVLRRNKEEIYLDMLKKYGQVEMVSVLAEINIYGYFKYFEEAGESELNEKHFKHYKIFKGSSEFDTKEMAILIDGIVSDCRDLEIETKSENELKNLKENWRK